MQVTCWFQKSLQVSCLVMTDSNKPKSAMIMLVQRVDIHHECMYVCIYVCNYVLLVDSLKCT